jgi:hypothetical protein
MPRRLTQADFFIEQMLEPADLIAPAFLPKALAAVSRLTDKMIQDYTNNGHIAYTTIQEGGRHWRVFSFLELTVATLISVLRNQGMETPVAIRFAGEARQPLLEWLGSGHTAVGAIVPDDWQPFRYLIVPEGSTTALLKDGLATLNRTKADSECDPSEPIIGKSCSFITIDLCQLVRHIMDELVKMSCAGTLAGLREDHALIRSGGKVHKVRVDEDGKPARSGTKHPMIAASTLAKKAEQMISQ